MISAADVPVESGQGYTITDVDGHQPEFLNDFTGDVQLTLVRNGQRLQVSGVRGTHRRLGAVLSERPRAP